MNKDGVHSFPIAALCAGNLSPDVTDEILVERFSTIGTVLSARVCRDSATNRSLGYGYVNFEKLADANMAISTMNNDLLKGYPCRLIMWSERLGCSNIFVTNLDESIGNEELHETFTEFGNILCCSITTDEKGLYTGYGFVIYETEEAVKEAIIANINGMLLNDQMVQVMKLMSKQQLIKHLKDLSDHEIKNVCITNLRDTFDDCSLRNMFNENVNITDGTGKHEIRGDFGFVSYETHETVLIAVRKSVEQQTEQRNRYHLNNVYIHNLEDAIDDERLLSEFSPYGTITSSKVMKDDNGNSKGYGFVCFSSPDEAAGAIKEMNAKILVTKPLYVVLAERKKKRQAQLEARKIERQNESRCMSLYIKNLEHVIDDNRLRSVFSNYGTVTSAKVMKDDNGKSKGFGFISFSSADEATKAITEMNDKILLTKRLFVGLAQYKQERQEQLSAQLEARKLERENKFKYMNVYVKNLEPIIDDDILRSEFSSYGTITSVKVMKDDNGKSMGFGFISFSSADEATKAITEMNDKILVTKRLFVGLAQRKQERQERLSTQFEARKLERQNQFNHMNVYVKNLEPVIDDDMLRSEFSSYGTITSAKVMKNGNGKSKGFGFVSFSSAEEATKAIADMNDVILVTKPIYVGLAQCKGERCTQLSLINKER